MSETSVRALGNLEAAQLFRLLLQVQLDKNIDKDENIEKLRRTIFELQGTLIQVDGLSEKIILVKLYKSKPFPQDDTQSFSGYKEVNPVQKNQEAEI